MRCSVKVVKAKSAKLLYVHACHARTRGASLDPKSVIRSFIRPFIVQFVMEKMTSCHLSFSCWQVRKTLYDLEFWGWGESVKMGESRFDVQITLILLDMKRYLCWNSLFLSFVDTGYNRGTKKLPTECQWGAKRMFSAKESELLSHGKVD